MAKSVNRWERERLWLTNFLFWDSDECRETLLKKKFFQSFHPEVLDLYVVSEAFFFLMGQSVTLVKSIKSIDLWHV